MGIYYSVVCHDCRTKIDLGKYSPFYPIESRVEALKEAKNEARHFRDVLVVGFLCQHGGHRVEVLNDAGGNDEYDKTEDYAEPVDYWTKTPEEKAAQS